MIDDKTRRAKGRLRESKSKLQTLLNITNSINDNASPAQLFSILKAVLTEELQIGKFALFTRKKENWATSLFKGVSENECNKIDIHNLAKTYEEIDIIGDDNGPNAVEFDVVIPVYHKKSPLAFMVLADFEGERIEISPIIKHLRFIQTLINIIVVALENKRLNSEQLKQIAVKKELELAQSMQSLLFPKTLPNNDNLKVKALYLPHSEVGGDYYDVVTLKDGKVVMCIADVSGKGMSAALLMANFQANLRALLTVADDIEQLVQFCNQKIIESADYQKFVTLFVCIYDPKTFTLKYVNSGHQPAILFNGKEVRLLKTGSTILGMFEELPSLASETIVLNKGAKLVCFTDGLTELEDSQGNQLEAEGIKILLEKQKTLAGILTKVKSKIRELEDHSGLDDDITFLTAEFLLP